MTLEAVKARTAMELARGESPTYPFHPTFPAQKPALVGLACRYLTEAPLDRGGCGSCPAKWVYPCEVFGRCSPAGYHPGVKRCSGCEHHTADAEKPEPAVRRLALVNNGAPGDVLALSAAIDRLHQAHPGRFVTAVTGTAAELLAHNPNVVAAEEVIDGRPVAWERAEVPSAGRTSTERVAAHCAFLSRALAVPVPARGARPQVLLTPAERERPVRVREFAGNNRYWVVGSDAAPEGTVAELAGQLAGCVPVVLVGASGSGPPPTGALDLRDALGLRELARVVACSAGGMGGDTLALLCETFGRSCVILPSGVGTRELEQVGSVLASLR